MIDVTISDVDTATNIQEWRVREDLDISDHKLIQAKITGTQQFKEWCRDLTNFDKEQFGQDLEESLQYWNPDPKTCEDITNDVGIFDAALKCCLEKQAKLRRRQTKMNALTFWNQELQEEKIKEATLYRKYPRRTK